ncbi:TonB-dependent receptor [Gaetbulibacter aquiaggeris]|uniref:TonB-dependent receptor n=1 Tax=Gaetbulibacter aquiaggeris TaxID=1735373 RepID=A0ABW7MMY8_9FLAO
MRKHLNKIILTVLAFSSTLVFSQEKDTIGTGVINVVKPYTPTISDAFKVKEVPSIDDEETSTKKEIKYNIFSFPVASTFTPAKGKAAIVEKDKPSKLFDNYASVGVGTYTSILGEVYLNHAISRSQSVGGYFRHHSSQGGIPDLLLDDNFSDSKVNVNYANRLRDLTWTAEGGFQQQQFNWYGLPQAMVDEASTNNIKGGHSFFGAHFGSDVTFENTYINSGSFLFRRFGDNQGSGENRFVVKSTFDIPVNQEEISTDVVFDYLGGSFDRNYMTADELKYANFQIGVTSKYEFKQDDLSISLGLSLFYLNDNEASESNFYIYPNVTASYRLVNDILIAYGGIKGGLIQNSYYDFASENPFVSPTLIIKPTDQLYNAYVGLQGKVSSNMSYNISGKYVADRNKALFINNEITATSQNYSYGNSFGIVYDDVDTFSFAGEINVDVNRNFKLGIKAEYFSYATGAQNEAWNLPDMKGSLFLDYQIDEHWFTGANLFYTGERKDQFYLNNPLIASTPFTVTLESFFDANLHLGYHVNEQLSIYAKGNNLANKGYERWQNFPVQSIQFLAGATYKFDF